MSNAEPDQSLAQVPWWLWPTVLCLDAPAVAVSWQGLIGRQAEARLAFHHAGLLAIAVWLAYAADRWIEGWRLTPQTVRTRRHYFYMRRRWPAFAVWLVTLLAGVALACAKLTQREWLGSVALLAVALLYLLSHQLFHRHHPARVPKEVCVSFLIAGGTVLYPALARPGMWASLLLSFAWLMTLALVNCLLISEWEREVDLSQGQSSLALTSASARGLARVLPAVAGLCAIACASLGPAATRPVSVAAALSSVVLCLLAKTQPRLGRERARVLVDLALLSPLLVMILG